MFIDVTIRDKSDLNYIINAPLNVPLIAIGDKTSSNKEITKNMWAISLDPTAIEKLVVQDFIKFLTKFLEKKEQQILQKHINGPVVFYMWFDEMAAQLRFNTIADFNNKLPFGCDVEVIDSPEPIIKDFLTSHYHDGIPWSELEPLEDNADDDEPPFVLKVFVAHINSID